VTDTRTRQTWLPVEGALGYRVYWGTDVAAVRTAGPDSPPTDKSSRFYRVREVSESE
jgi:hypothetical protein